MKATYRVVLTSPVEEFEARTFSIRSQSITNADAAAERHLSDLKAEYRYFDAAYTHIRIDRMDATGRTVVAHGALGGIR